MILKARIKESLKALFSSGYVHQITLSDIIKIIGEGEIKNFIQIGSNDGLKNDPVNQFIRKYNWKGVLVEPDSGNFEKLVLNYKGDENVVFEKAGIGPVSSEMNFYKLSNILDTDPDWYNQIGSFDKTTFLKNIDGFDGLLERMTEEKIPVITFEQLMSKRNLKSIDLLHTDTEGYDYKILKSIDFAKYQIKVVYFETEWMTQFELREIFKYLRGFNYKIFQSGIDHIAVKL